MQEKKTAPKQSHSTLTDAYLAQFLCRGNKSTNWSQTDLQITFFSTSGTLSDRDWGWKKARGRLKCTAASYETHLFHYKHTRTQCDIFRGCIDQQRRRQPSNNDAQGFAAVGRQTSDILREKSFVLRLFSVWTIHTHTHTHTHIQACRLSFL